MTWPSIWALPTPLSMLKGTASYSWSLRWWRSARGIDPRQKAIPDIVIGRLPIYLRALQHMAQEGRQVTSSQELGERLGISAAQIRKDLFLFEHLPLITPSQYHYHTHQPKCQRNFMCFVYT